VTRTRTTRDEALDAAEMMMRTAGYNGFTTREVAESIGIKASSVHYYFPTKSDIGAEVTRRYTDRFVAELGDPGQFPGDERKAVEHYVEAFRVALIRDGALCLSVVLGAEIGGLPPDVAAAARVFFERNLNWLTTALNSTGTAGREAAVDRATLVLASLEGGMILSRTLDDFAVFERVAKDLVLTAAQ
jgi:TetR/AcrR family transcriptional repressor of nem operon